MRPPEGERRRRRLKNPVPAEGADGKFSETWWPICLSSELAAGAVVGKPFLDGRIVVFRGEDGVARTMSAYCPHFGADLSVGRVVGNRVQCAFHKWEYGSDGYCVKTGNGDPVPPGACLYAFPTQEKYGLIWAFNGETPTFEIPSFEPPDDQLLMYTGRLGGVINCDGWCFSCNTPDFNHLVAVHEVTLLSRKLHRATAHCQEWHYELRHWKDEPTSFRVGIHGSNIFVQNSEFDGRYGGAIVPFSCPEPGQHEVFFVTAVLKGSGAEAEAQERWLEEFTKMEREFGAQDFDILNTIHYTPGTLTRGDEYLARFLDYLRAYPRAHPSADFIS